MCVYVGTSGFFCCWCCQLWISQYTIYALYVVRTFFAQCSHYSASGVNMEIGMLYLQDDFDVTAVSIAVSTVVLMLIIIGALRYSEIFIW